MLVTVCSKTTSPPPPLTPQPPSPTPPASNPKPPSTHPSPFTHTLYHLSPPTPHPPPPHTDLHRYDVSTLRPFEVMYVDNKSYPCVVRGGQLVAFVLVDLKTFAIFKVDLRSKAHNGYVMPYASSCHARVFTSSPTSAPCTLTTVALWCT